MNANKILLPALVALAILVGSVGALGIGSYVNTAVSANTQANPASIWGSAYQNISYNNPNTINRTTVLKQIATVAQCRTNFANSAAPIVASATKSNLRA